MDEPDFRLVDHFDQQSQIFKKEDVFEPSYIPESLYHRENELSALANHFKAIITKSSNLHSKQVIIQGSVGLGKTAVAKHFGLTLESYSQKNSDSSLEKILFFHLNCRRLRSWNLIFTSILRQLVPAFPLRGFSASELLEFLESILEERKQKLLLCLDEIDHLISVSNGQDILYSLIRGTEGNRRGKTSMISLVLITRNPNFHTFLDPALFSSLSKRMIIFPAYTLLQLYDIVSLRAEQGLKFSAYSPEILKMIAEIAHKQKDARYAIELLWRAGKTAEGEKVREILYEHVRKAQISSFPLKQSLITDLPQHQKLVLFTIAQLLRQRNNEGYILSNEIKREYEITCGIKGVTPRKQTQFWIYIQELTKSGLITSEVINRHNKGKSQGRTATISISDFPVCELTNVLDDIL
jgi:cell division control protein 6